MFDFLSVEKDGRITSYNVCYTKLLRMDELLKCAKPIMEELSNLTYHSCHMSILYDGKLMVVAQNRRNNFV